MALREFERRMKMKTGLRAATVFGLVMLLTISVEAQSEFSGKWNELGIEDVSLIISNISGNYTAVFVMGQNSCQLDVSILGNNIHMTGRYDSSQDIGVPYTYYKGPGSWTYLEFNLMLSHDGTCLIGTEKEDIDSPSRRAGKEAWGGWIRSFTTTFYRAKDNNRVNTQPMHNPALHMKQLEP
jgi:hypothetical protein